MEKICISGMPGKKFAMWVIFCPPPHRYQMAVSLEIKYITYRVTSIYYKGTLSNNHISHRIQALLVELQIVTARLQYASMNICILRTYRNICFHVFIVGKYRYEITHGFIICCNNPYWQSIVEIIVLYIFLSTK